MTSGPGNFGVGIAVVGLAARLPGAPSMRDFEALIRSGRSAVRRFTPEELRAAGVPAARLADPRFVLAKGFIEDADCFDLAFFRMTPALARAMDPQHRLFLECCWQALEDAGLTAEPSGCRIGVFAGASAASSYYHTHAAHDPDTVRALDPFQAYIVNQPAALPNQVSFHLDLTGPSVAVQTACSTGLAAVVAACQSLADVQCDAAIAGAVTLALPLVDGYTAPPGSILSPTGACAPFDASADGTVPGDGVAAVVLRRLGDALADGDRVHAVIRGYGVTNDGGRKAGFSAPSARGQAAAIADALAMAEIEPREIGFLETHGTGTAIGDAIEIAALKDVFSGCPAGGIALGATKAQIGHLDVAAGLAGFIKAVVAVEAGIVPPLAGASRPNAELGLEASPFRVPMAALPWPAGAEPRRAGISSFGMGGTNVHLVIEQASDAWAGPTGTPRQGLSVLPLSAPSADGLERLSAGMASFMAEEPPPALADVGTTLARRRRAFPCRRAVVASTAADAVRQLRGDQPDGGTGRAVGAGRGVAFVFTGQGSQPVGFARALRSASPSFARALDLCRRDLAEIGCDIDPYLFGAADDRGLRDRLGDTEIAQPTLFAFAYAHAAMLEAWGLVPSAVIGHSLGELVALCVAGALERKAALALVVARGRAMQKLDAGAMLAASAPAPVVERHLASGCEIAAYNGPSQVVAGGPVDSIDGLASRLAGAGIRTHRLASRLAFHTASMVPAASAIGAAASAAALRPPRIPVVSNLTGGLFADDRAPDPGYFALQARSPVRFGEGIALLLESGHRSFLEIGAGAGLTGLIRAAATDGGLRAVAAMPRPGAEDEIEQTVRAVAQAWTAGADLDWRKVDVLAKGRTISLPPYPFARTRCWVDSQPAPEEPAPPAPPPARLGRHPGDILAAVQELWAVDLGHERIGADDDYHRLGGDSLAAVRIAEHLSSRFGVGVGPGDFLRAPTPRLLAALIEGRRRGDAAREGIVIDARAADGEEDLLVLFHTIGGTAHLYGELVSTLPGHRPIRLVQALPFAGRGPQPDTVEAMTEVYLAELGLDRERPVHFAGASFGGLIAFEAAEQWRARHGSPASVIMLDSPAPGAIAASIADEADLLAFVSRLLGRPIPTEELRRLSPDMRERRIVDLIAELLPETLDRETSRIYLDTLRANARAMNGYRPCPSGATSVTLVAAEIRDPGQPPHPERGWQPLLRAALSVETVPGGHLSMLALPHVTATARVIERAIERSGSRPALPARARVAT